MHQSGLFREKPSDTKDIMASHLANVLTKPTNTGKYTTKST